jgi:hypothetical protein
VKVFDLSPALRGCQITSYRASADGKWLALLGSAPGSPEARAAACAACTLRCAGLARACAAR